VRVILLPGGKKAAHSFLLYRIRYMSPIYLNEPNFTPCGPAYESVVMPQRAWS